MKINSQHILLFLLGAVVFCAACGDPPAPKSKPPLYPSLEPGTDRGAKFIIFGDSRTKNILEVWRASGDEERVEIIQAMKRESPAFIMNLGDLVLCGDNETHWRLFDEENKCLRQAGIPYLVTIGNHDVKGELPKSLENLAARFPLLKGQRWYSFTYRNAAFLVLDSNYPQLTAAEKYRQYPFIEKEVERFDRDEKIKFIIPCFHHPPFTNVIVHKGYKYVKDEFLPRLLKSPKVYALFAGHVHTYEHFKLMGRHFINSGGGGAPPHKVFRGKLSRYEDLHKGYKGFHYSNITLREDSFTVTVRMLDPKGNWFTAEEFTLPETE